MTIPFTSILSAAVLPVCTSLAFRAAKLTLIDYRLAECPVPRSTTYYFSASTGNDNAYRYVRYLGPTNGFCNVSEVEFYNGVTKLTGSYIGTSGSFGSDPNTVGAKAFDGNLGTFFNGPNATGDWAGLDLGSAQPITSVKYCPRVSWGSRMVGGKFQASTTADFSANVTTLYTVASSPTEGVLTTQSITQGDGTIDHPYQTLTKAQAMIDAGSSDFAIQLMAGDTWLITSGVMLIISKPSVTVGRYGTGANPLLQRNVLPYTAIASGWTNAATRGDAYSSTYSRSEASTIAAFRERGNITSPYVRRTSISAVNTYKGSWYQTGGVIYINPVNTNNAFDAFANNADYDGILVTADGCRIDGLRIEGVGCHLTTPHNSKWCIKSESASGRIATVISNCETYFGATHLIGATSANSGASSYMTVVNTRMGWGGSDNSAWPIHFVNYATYGGQETLLRDIDFVGGTIPDAGRTSGSYPYPKDAAQGFYGHTNGSNYESLGIASRCRIADNTRFQLPNLGTWGDMPSNAGDLAATRGFRIDCQGIGRLTLPEDATEASNVGITMNGMSVGPYCVAINEQLRITTPWTTAATTSYAINPASITGTQINGTFVIDLSGWQNINPTYVAFDVFTASTQWFASLYNCHVHWQGGFGVKAGLVRGAFVDQLGITSGGAFNTIFSSGLPPAGTAYVALNNSSTYLSNNAYMGMSGKTDAGGGYSNDPYLVELAVYFPGIRPEAGSPLVSTHTQSVRGYRLEYDADWQMRDITHTAIGPREIDRAMVFYPALT